MMDLAWMLLDATKRENVSQVSTPAKGFYFIRCWSNMWTSQWQKRPPGRRAHA